MAFQWSAHKVPKLGDVPEHTEWLNAAEVWPNHSLVDSLRLRIGDDGPVLTWSEYERTVLRDIASDLATFGREWAELVAWIEDLSARRIVDMHEWARCWYYHPGMKGRTSIKVVLDALWRTDAVMRRQFESWTGLRAVEESDPTTKEKWSRLLSEYCALDTLSMVLILEHWRRVTGLG